MPPSSSLRVAMGSPHLCVFAVDLPVNGVSLVKNPVERRQSNVLRLTDRLEFQRPPAGPNQGGCVSGFRLQGRRWDRLGPVPRNISRLGELRSQDVFGETFASKTPREYQRPV